MAQPGLTLCNAATVFVEPFVDQSGKCSSIKQQGTVGWGRGDTAQKPFFIPGRHMCDIEGVGLRVVTSHPPPYPHPPIPLPHPLGLYWRLPPTTLDYPKTSIDFPTMCFCHVWIADGI